MELKSWMLFIIILFVIPYMTVKIRKPYTAMMQRKESLKIELENEIAELRQYERELDKEDRKPSAEFQDDIDRLKARYEKDIKELQEDHDSHTLNEILIVLTTLSSVVIAYVTYRILDKII